MAWAAFTAVVVRAPEFLQPASWLAMVLLILIPLGPLGVPALLFSALVPPRFVLGVVDHIEDEWVGKLARLQVEGETLYATPETLNAIAKGHKVRLLVVGKTVQRIQPV